MRIIEHNIIICSLIYFNLILFFQAALPGGSSGTANNGQGFSDTDFEQETISGLETGFITNNLLGFGATPSFNTARSLPSYLILENIYILFVFDSQYFC